MAISYYKPPAGAAQQAPAKRPVAGGKPVRRSQRVNLRMPVLAFGERAQGHSFDFKEPTFVVRVSAHGGQLELEHGVEMGHKFMLRHANRADETECRVVAVSKSPVGRRLVGFEFIDGLVDFWRMSFPRPGARPVIEKNK